MASLGDLIKPTIHSFFASGNSLSAFQLKTVARLAASRLLVAVQAPMSIHFFTVERLLFSAERFQKTETPLDCRTAHLVWSHNTPFLKLTILTGSPESRADQTIDGYRARGRSCDHMIRTRRKRASTSPASRFSREQRRALKKLAGNPRGLSEHFLLAHGFSVEMLSSLVLANLAAIVIEPMMERRGVTLMVELIRITEAGRMWLEG